MTDYELFKNSFFVNLNRKILFFVCFKVSTAGSFYEFKKDTYNKND